MKEVICQNKKKKRKKVVVLYGGNVWNSVNQFLIKKKTKGL